MNYSLFHFLLFSSFFNLRRVLAVSIFGHLYTDLPALRTCNAVRCLADVRYGATYGVNLPQIWKQRLTSSSALFYLKPLPWLKQNKCRVG